MRPEDQTVPGNDNGVARGFVAVRIVILVRYEVYDGGRDLRRYCGFRSDRRAGGDGESCGGVYVAVDV